ncbi:hypothetical protein [Qipengyuania nanhaisediminis]|uniref:hypothetical protein n=1 Tax=Qipengyuania nanhaisediminis TaxID=604088 RepID=UPI0038B41069
MKLRNAVLGAAALAVSLHGAAQAQAIKTEPPMKAFTAEEIAAIPVPETSFDYASVNPKDYEKYFYFHRPETSFDEAYADILECDSLGSGINIYMGADSSSIASAMTQYGVAAGAIGGLVGSVLADAIFGSAERRKMKRINIRQCMFYKGYDRFGLEKDLWQEFHFEEGHGRKDEDERIAALEMQARVASGPRPTTEVLEP